MQSLRLFRALVLPLLVAAAPVASVAPSAVAAPAQQQAGKVDAEYNILLGGLTIGRFALDTVFDDKGYTITARGSTSGVSRFVSDGKGFLKSSGRIVGSRVLPAAYMLDTSENGRRNSTVSMQMNSGTIVNVAAMPPLAKKADRVPLLPQILDEDIRQNDNGRHEGGRNDVTRLDHRRPQAAATLSCSVVFFAMARLSVRARSDSSLALALARNASRPPRCSTERRP